MIEHFKNFKDLIIDSKSLAYTLTVILGLVIAQFIKSLIDDLLIPILYSFFNNKVEEENKFWKNLQNKSIRNPISNKIINLKFGNIASNFIYLIILFIIIYIIYINVFKKIDESIFNK